MLKLATNHTPDRCKQAEKPAAQTAHLVLLTRKPKLKKPKELFHPTQKRVKQPKYKGENPAKNEIEKTDICKQKLKLWELKALQSQRT